MKRKAVLFDFDGTIADTNQLIIDSWKHTHREIYGQEMEEARIIATFGEMLLESFAREFPGQDMDKLLRLYRTFQKERFLDVISIFPGVYELISELKKSGYLVGIVTSRMRETTIQALDSFGLTGFTDAIVAGEDTTRHKPNPDPVLKALQMLDIPASDSIMVGDSAYDMLAAKAANVETVFVRWSVAAKADELDAGARPGYIIDEAGDLLDVVKKYFK